jgi:hypothetical protein
MSFIYTVPEGLLSAAASTAALSAEMGGHSAQAAAVAAVVPPGPEEISAANVAKIMAYAANITGVLAGASAVQAMYGASTGLSSTMMSLGDAMSELELISVL